PATRNRSTPAARSRNHGLVRDFESLFTPTLHNAQKVSCGPVHAQAHQPCYTNLVQLLHGGPARPTASPLVMPIKSEALRRAGGILTTPETKARPHRGCGNQAHIREVRLEEGQSPRT